MTNLFRIPLVFATMIVGVVVPSAAVLIPALLGAQLAYDGLRRRTLAGFTAILVFAELVAGFDLGVLSLSYLLVALLVAFARRFAVIAPWAAQEGWHIADLVRTVLTACILAGALTACSVLVGALAGHRVVVERLASELALGRVWPLVPLCAGFVCVFRRIEVPFRRPIRFGT